MITTQDVWAVLKDSRFPLTTTQVVLKVSAVASQDARQQTASALERLHGTGCVVTATLNPNLRSKAPENPYQFIASPRCLGWWWMAKDRADAFKHELERIRAEKVRTAAMLARLRHLVSLGLKGSIECTGQYEIYAFRLRGDLEALSRIVSAVEIVYGLSDPPPPSSDTTVSRGVTACGPPSKLHFEHILVRDSAGSWVTWCHGSPALERTTEGASLCPECARREIGRRR